MHLSRINQEISSNMFMAHFIAQLPASAWAVCFCLFIAQFIAHTYRTGTLSFPLRKTLLYSTRTWTMPSFCSKLYHCFDLFIVRRVSQNAPPTSAHFSHATECYKVSHTHTRTRTLSNFFWVRAFYEVVAQCASLAALSLSLSSSLPFSLPLSLSLAFCVCVNVWNELQVQQQQQQQQQLTRTLIWKQTHNLSVIAVIFHSSAAVAGAGVLVAWSSASIRVRATSSMRVHCVCACVCMFLTLLSAFCFRPHPLPCSPSSPALRHRVLSARIRRWSVNNYAALQYTL